jgi:hypothetical protein
MFQLYSFSPDTLMTAGYRYRGEYATEQLCNDAAFAGGYTHYRIELDLGWGSRLVFESAI